MDFPGELGILIDEITLRTRVHELATEISEANKDKPLLLVGVLNGAAIFLADLVRAINLPVEYDFISISSYGNETYSSGQVTVLKNITVPVENKNVLIVEDIIDTGLTLAKSGILEECKMNGAADVSICTLLNKPSRRISELHINYNGFEIPDEFVVGYGLDYKGLYRNLNYIATLKA